MPHPHISRLILTTSLLAAGSLSSQANAAFDDSYLGLAWGSSESDSSVNTGSGILPASPANPTAAPLMFPLRNVAVGSGGDSWSVLAGLPLQQYLDLELAYTTLGSFDSPMVPDLDLEPTELSLSLKGHFALNQRFSALWLLGLSRTSFESGGTMRYIAGRTAIQAAPGDVIGIYGSFGSFIPPGAATPVFPGGTITTTTLVPVEEPGDERGYLWGFGFSWKGTQQLELELRFTRHELQIMNVDKLSAGLLYRF